MIRIVLNGQPVGKGRPRFGKGHAYTPAKTKNYEKDLAWAAKTAMQGRQPFDGPLRVHLTAFLKMPKKAQLFPVAKPDLDNIIKMLDSCNNIVWADDAQIIEVFAQKRYSEEPKLVIEVYPPKLVEVFPL